MRIPGLASMSDMGRNAYSMFNLGFNPRGHFGNIHDKFLDTFESSRAGGGGIASSTLKGFGSSARSAGLNGTPLSGRFSVGGMLSTGGLMAAGAGVGAALGSQVDGGMIGTGAAIGAAAGLAALPAAGLATRGVYELGKGVVKAAPAISRNLPGAAAGVGKAALNVVRNAPIASNLGGATLGFASMMVDWDKMKNAGNILESVRLTGPLSGARAGAKAGWAAGKSLPGKIAKAGGQGAAGSIINGKNILVGSSLLKGAASAFNEWNRQHMGRMDGQIRTSTPRVPMYMDDSGATGDLVFALNANRRG